MGFRCGIVGLPNVGKSSLFNALSKTAAAEVGNYPFCTVEPNLARIPVPDRALEAVAALAKSKQIVPSVLEVVDIAGLVEGASRGEGLGNRFLGQIREVDAIIHVVRCFESDEVAHVSGAVDPLRDIAVIETELMLADLESLERQRESTVKRARGGDPEETARLAVIDVALAALAAGDAARSTVLDKESDKRLFAGLQLLTAKPVLYACNVDEAAAARGNAHAEAVARHAATHGAPHVVVSAAIEGEIAALESDEERAAFLADLGLAESGLERVIHAGYRLLGLIRFITAGPKEAHAWTIADGDRAIDAAARIHTDFARGFICAETISLADYLNLGGEQPARDAGKMRQEGRDYVVRDGDVILFRFNV